MNKKLFTSIFKYCMFSDSDDFKIKCLFHSGRLMEIDFFHYKSEKKIKFESSDINIEKDVLPFFENMANKIKIESVEKFENMVDSLFIIAELQLIQNEIKINSL